MIDKASKHMHLLLAVAVSILLRWCVSLFPYSGQNKPPLYGDYEAQRHWMEITLNLPAKEWYFNTSDNDLQYWGLDYPPLTAYHSLVCGYVANYQNKEFVALNASRGHESYKHKVFMRSTVIVADMLVYIPALLYFFSDKCTSQITKTRTNLQKTCYETNVAALYLALIYPGLVLIDHGHFQYNGVSLGLTIAAVAALLRNKLILAALTFSLALNYKQMELYHALPFFCYMLGVSLPTQGNRLAVKKLSYIAVTVITAFLIIWAPFLSDLGTVHQVLNRLFPLYRGVFEDKVANVWCTLNVIYKLRNIVNHITMAKICLFTTIIAALPSCLDLLFHPEKRKFLLSLINISLAFFLFSFHVHEKSILLVAIPAILYFPVEPFPVFWFLLLSNFSMLPLILKDNLFIPFVALTLFYYISVTVIVDIGFNSECLKLKSDAEPSQSKSSIIQKGCSDFKLKKQFPTEMCVLRNTFMLSLLGCIVLTFTSIAVKPPQKYPDLFPLLVSIYSFAHFMFFFLYFICRQVFSKAQFV